jgi:hypothetical protein
MVVFGVVEIWRGVLFLHEAQARQLAGYSTATDEYNKPFVVASLTTHTAVSASDPNEEPFELEYIRFLNIGPDAALGVSIVPARLPTGRIDLWSGVSVLLKDQSDDCQFKGSISTELKRLRKLLGLDYGVEIRVPLLVLYHDRRGAEYRTPHAIILRGSETTIDHLHQEPSGDYWTRLEA